MLQHFFAVILILLTLMEFSTMARFSTTGKERVCSPHIPLPIDDYFDWERCRREVKAAKRFKDPNADKRTAELVLENGYILKTYTVTSKDGYIMTIYRVPGKGKSGRGKKPSVLVQHAFARSSDSWFVLPPGKNLIFKLVDAGYDVWIPNGRGTYSSRGHVRLDWEWDMEYWDFSFHEKGMFDLPLIVDLILEESGNEKLSYIGYSQGASMFLVATSEIPEMNEKFDVAFLLAPAAFLGRAYMEPYIRLLNILYTPLELPPNYSPKYYDIRIFIQPLIFENQKGRLDFRSPGKFMADLNIGPVDICSVAALQCGMCTGAFQALLDFNPHQANFSNTANILRMVDTVNLKSAIHLGQNILSCQFRKFDYGPAKNIRLYGRTEPPQYHLGNVRVPIHLIYGEQDSFATPPDVHRLAKEINSKVLRGVHRVNDDTFNHGDFVTGRDADTLVYDLILDLINE